VDQFSEHGLLEELFRADLWPFLSPAGFASGRLARVDGLSPPDIFDLLVFSPIDFIKVILPGLFSLSSQQNIPLSQNFMPTEPVSV
jgi:hypothetical protein